MITVINVTITGLFFANLPSFTQRLKYEKKKRSSHEGYFSRLGLLIPSLSRLLCYVMLYNITLHKCKKNEVDLIYTLVKFTNKSIKLETNNRPPSIIMTTLNRSVQVSEAPLQLPGLSR